MSEPAQSAAPAVEPSPFHSGELRAQARAGGGASGAAIRDFLTEQHRAFFALLPFLAVATTDDTGWPVATLLTGPAGFVSSPDARTLRIATRPDPSDPAAPHLGPEASVGLLGIDLATRRRNRVNGIVAAADEAGMRVAVRQGFGNCPQYIQAREVDHVAATPADPESLARLDAQARGLIGAADTFFVASSAGRLGGAAGGADISHRGGRPGFVRIDADALTIPDFRGNRYFNTLGNLMVEPRAALLFVDFATGDVVHLRGTAEIVWDGEEARAFDGAERLWRFHVNGGWRRRRALALRWTFRDHAPTTLRTGTWSGDPAPRSSPCVPPASEG